MDFVYLCKNIIAMSRQDLEMFDYNPKDMERKRPLSVEQDVLLVDGKLVNAHSDMKADKEFNILCSDGVVRSFKWNFNYKGEP